jgi:hypothetical protein
LVIGFIEPDLSKKYIQISDNVLQYFLEWTLSILALEKRKQKEMQRDWKLIITTAEGIKVVLTL